jgi:hypothetical protein
MEGNHGLKIAVDDDCRIAARFTITAKNSIHLERDVVLAPDMLVMDHAHAYVAVAAGSGAAAYAAEGCRTCVRAVRNSRCCKPSLLFLRARCCAGCSFCAACGIACRAAHRPHVASSLPDPTSFPEPDSAPSVGHCTLIGLLTSSLFWFRNLVGSMGDNLTIRLVSKGDCPVAAILTLSHKTTATYKYGLFR